MTQVPLDLLRLILWPRKWSSLVNVLYALRTSMCNILLLLGGGFNKYQIQLVEGALALSVSDSICQSLRRMVAVSSSSCGFVSFLRPLAFAYCVGAAISTCTCGIVVSSWCTHLSVLSPFSPDNFLLLFRVSLVWYYRSHLNFLLISVFTWYMFFCSLTFNYFYLIDFPTRLVNGHTRS